MHLIHSIQRRVPAGDELVKEGVNEMQVDAEPQPQQRPQQTMGSQPSSTPTEQTVALSQSLDPEPAVRFTTS